MRAVSRTLSVWLLAVAFAASGTAWRHCMAAQSHASQPTPVSEAHQDHHHASSAHDHSGHHGDHVLDHQQAATDDSSQPLSGDHTCGKCCSACTVSGVMAASPDAAVLAVSPI